MNIQHVLLEVVRAGEALPAVLALERLGGTAVNALVGAQIAYPREFPAAERMAAGVRLFTCVVSMHGGGGRVPLLWVAVDLGQTTLFNMVWNGLKLAQLF